MIKNLLYIVILTSAVILSWIGFSVYHSFITSTITPDQNVVITPIPGQFDQKTLNKIKNRQAIEPNLSEVKIATDEDEESSRSATPEATNSAQINL